MLLVVIPQAVRRMVPAIVSQLVTLLKDSSLGFIITYEELLRRSRITGEFFHNPLQTTVVVALMYIAVNLVLGRLARWLEIRQRRRLGAGAIVVTGVEDLNAAAGSVVPPHRRPADPSISRRLEPRTSEGAAGHRRVGGVVGGVGAGARGRWRAAQAAAAVPEAASSSAPTAARKAGAVLRRGSSIHATARSLAGSPAAEVTPVHDRDELAVADDEVARVGVAVDPHRRPVPGRSRSSSSHRRPQARAVDGRRRARRARRGCARSGRPAGCPRNGFAGASGRSRHVHGGEEPTERAAVAREVGRGRHQRGVARRSTDTSSTATGSPRPADRPAPARGSAGAGAAPAPAATAARARTSGTASCAAGEPGHEVVAEAEQHVVPAVRHQPQRPAGEVGVLLLQQGAHERLVDTSSSAAGMSWAGTVAHYGPRAIDERWVCQPLAVAFFGIRFDLRNPEFAGTSMHERYTAALDMTAWAERVGFLFVGLSEHHGSEDGYLPSPLVMAGAVAARTESVAIVVAAMIAPFHDPLRLAEDAAVVDNLCGGRLELIIAGGYVARRVRHVRCPPWPSGGLARPSSSRTLQAAWTGEPFEYRGRTVQVAPRPHRPGGPGLQLGGSSAPAARRAARLGIGFQPSNGDSWPAYAGGVRRPGSTRPRPVPGRRHHGDLRGAPPRRLLGVDRPLCHARVQRLRRWAEAAGIETGYRTA